MGRDLVYAGHCCIVTLVPPVLALDVGYVVAALLQASGHKQPSCNGLSAVLMHVRCIILP